MEWEEFLAKVRRGEVVLTKAPAIFDTEDEWEQESELPEVYVRWTVDSMGFAAPILIVADGDDEEVVSDIPPGLEILLAEYKAEFNCRCSLGSRTISYIERSAEGKIFYIPLKQICFRDVFAFGWYSGELQCPYCGLEFNHIVRVVVVQYPTAVSVQRSAIKTFQGFRVASSRGSTVALSFECENQHIWTLFLTFHKGTIYATVEVMEEYNKEGELWRD